MKLYNLNCEAFLHLIFLVSVFVGVSAFSISDSVHVTSISTSSPFFLSSPESVLAGVAFSVGLAVPVEASLASTGLGSVVGLVSVAVVVSVVDLVSVVGLVSVAVGVVVSGTLISVSVFFSEIVTLSVPVLLVSSVLGTVC